MPARPLMNVIVSNNAKIAVDTLSDEDRRIVFAWFDHLKNWHNDAHVRSQSQKLNSANLYSLRTSAGMIIVFDLQEDDITILSIFRKESLQNAEAMVGHVGV